MKKPILPPPAEWDFRGIPGVALPDATLYEYARSAKAIRRAAVKWLNGDCLGKPLREGLAGALKAKDADGLFRLRCKGAVQGAGILRNPGLVELLLDRPDFPAPWTAAPPEYRMVRRGGYCLNHRPGEAPVKYGRLLVEIDPICDFVRHVALRARADGDDIETRVEWLRGRGFFLKVDWEGTTVKEIIRDFEKWLRSEAANHTDELRPRGKVGQQPIAPLKWLAAWRLREAGFGYEEAMARMPKPGPQDKRQILPTFSDPAGWSDAITAAEKRLTDFEISSL